MQKTNTYRISIPLMPLLNAGANATSDTIDFFQTEIGPATLEVGNMNFATKEMVSIHKSKEPIDTETLRQKFKVQFPTLDVVITKQ